MNTRVCLALAILALGLLVPTASAGVPPPTKTICTGTVCLDIVTHPPGRPPVLEEQAFVCFRIGGTRYCRFSQAPVPSVPDKVFLLEQQVAFGIGGFIICRRCR